MRYNSNDKSETWHAHYIRNQIPEILKIELVSIRGYFWEMFEENSVAITYSELSSLETLKLNFFTSCETT